MPNRSRFIRHVTLTTGHVRDSYPGEVSPEAISVCRDLIEGITAGEVSEPIPGTGYYLTGRGSHHCLVATVWPPPKNPVVTFAADFHEADLDEIPELTDEQLAGAKRRRGMAEPIATIGVATHSRCGASLWRNLHIWGSLPVVTDPDNCPPEPWVAAALEAPAMHTLDAMRWLGDFERVLAWAWLERSGVPTKK